MEGRSIARLALFEPTHRYQPIRTLDHLHLYLQQAVTLEFATIPAYGTAMYSMRDKSCDAFRLTLSVLMEEMFHVYQAANLLISVGGVPRFTGDFTPRYPTFIPHGDKRSTPYIALRGATPALYRDVFMSIEKPAAYEAPPENENIQTIGQFYKAIEDGICYLEDEAQRQGRTIFQDTPGYAQHQDYAFGRGGGRIVLVRDLASARLAIMQIVQQGEGAVRPGQTMVAEQPWGAYNHYGVRSDGHYGPMVDGTQELSHYFKFKRIADGLAPLPVTFPVVAVPSIGEYRNERARHLVDAFNLVYSSLLHALEDGFRAGVEARRNYFSTAVPIMHRQLPMLAEAIMRTPIWPEGDARVGPNALPTWEYQTPSLPRAVHVLQRARDMARDDASDHLRAEHPCAFGALLDAAIGELKRCCEMEGV